MDEPRKVSPASVEIIGTHGEVVQESKEKKNTAEFRETPFGTVRVVRGGPWLLLALPVLIPLILFAFFFLAVLALFFGKTVFKLAGKSLRRQ